MTPRGMGPFPSDYTKGILNTSLMLVRANIIKIGVIFRRPV